MTVQPFLVIGIAVRTTNENGQAAKDIPLLWQQFMAEGMANKIPAKEDDSLYCIYTDYEKDHTKPYTTILGCRVTSLQSIPEGMIGRTITGGNYTLHTAKGNILQGMVFDAWVKIWNSNSPRVYTADFEVYGSKAANPEQAEVDIFIATP
jgi:predicted transcriptional regulator YdeE